MQSGAPKMHSEAERGQMWSAIQKNIPARPVAEIKTGKTKRIGIVGVALIAFFGAAAFTSAVVYINKPDRAPEAVGHGPVAYPPRPAAEVGMPADEPVQSESIVPDAAISASSFTPVGEDPAPRRDLSASAAPVLPSEPASSVTEPVVAQETLPETADTVAIVAAPPVQTTAKADKVPVVVKKPVVVNNEEVKVVKVKSRFSKQGR